MAIASLVLGIIALLNSFFHGLIGFIIAILGLIFGILGRKEEGKYGLAIAGIVCSSIALAFDLAFIFLFSFVMLI